MNKESTTSNNPEQRITIEKPEKDPRRIEAGKKLAAFNKMVRKKKESGDELKEPEQHHPEESTCDNEETSNTTKILLLLGAVGFGYYLYTTTTNNGKEEVVQQPTVQNNNNNEVQENTVSSSDSSSVQPHFHAGRVFLSRRVDAAWNCYAIFTCSPPPGVHEPPLNFFVDSARDT